MAKGKPVDDGEVASLTISAAGKRANDWSVCPDGAAGVVGMGDAAADGPREDRSGV